MEDSPGAAVQMLHLIYWDWSWCLELTHVSESQHVEFWCSLYVDDMLFSVTVTPNLTWEKLIWTVNNTVILEAPPIHSNVPIVFSPLLPRLPSTSYFSPSSFCSVTDVSSLPLFSSLSLFLYLDLLSTLFFHLPCCHVLFLGLFLSPQRQTIWPQPGIFNGFITGRVMLLHHGQWLAEWPRCLLTPLYFGSAGHVQCTAVLPRRFTWTDTVWLCWLTAFN